MSDSEQEEMDIAAIMGFGSFGAQPQLKRRKMNDATVDSSTGANTTSLGIRRKADDAAITQQAEMPQAATNQGDTATPDPTPGQPPRLTNKEKRAKKQASSGGGLAGYISRGQAITEPLIPPSTTNLIDPPGSETQSSFITTSTQNAVDPALSKELSNLSPDELYRLRKGVVDGKGEIVYFQPSFLEDPWAQNASHRGAR